MFSLAYSLGGIGSIALSGLYAIFRRRPSKEPALQNDVAAVIEKFPNDAIFTRLLRLSIERPDLQFHDDYGVDANYDDLIRDIIHVRRVLQKQLPESSFDENGLLREDASSIAFLAFSGYNFIISFLAIVALGGVCIPLCKSKRHEKAVSGH